MKVAAFQQLPSHPAAIALPSADKVLVLIAGGETAGVHAFDHELSPMWHYPLTKPATAMIAKNGICWALDESGATALDGRGQRVAQVELNPKERLHPSSFAVLDDGLVIAWEHNRNARMFPPIVERVDFQGHLVWSTALPIETVAYKGVVEIRAETGWEQKSKPAWTPETWVSNVTTLPLSGSRVFVSFTEMPRSGIGMGYALSLADGIVCFRTKKGPIDEISSLDNGVFLVGYQGYGAFETLQYGPQGDIENQWSSHGYCVVGPDDTRVIEMENILPSKSRLARLGPAGKIDRGDRLDGYYTSRPYRHRDGAIVFLRNGAAHLVRDLQIVESVKFPDQTKCFYSPSIGEESSVFCAQSTTGAGPTRQTSIIRIDL